MAEKKAVKTQTKKKKLVIVESPTKVDSVKKISGKRICHRGNDGACT